MRHIKAALFIAIIVGLFVYSIFPQWAQAQSGDCIKYWELCWGLDSLCVDTLLINVIIEPDDSCGASIGSDSLPFGTSYFCSIIGKDSLFFPAADFDSLHAAHVQLDSAAYINWENEVGSDGFGLRNNAGNIQIKSEGGSWANIVSSADTATTLFDYLGMSLGDTIAAKAIVPRDSLSGTIGTATQYTCGDDSSRGGPWGSAWIVDLFMHPESGSHPTNSSIYEPVFRPWIILMRTSRWPF